MVEGIRMGRQRYAAIQGTVYGASAEDLMGLVVASEVGNYKLRVGFDRG